MLGVLPYRVRQRQDDHPELRLSAKLYQLAEGLDREHYQSQKHSVIEKN